MRINAFILIALVVLITLGAHAQNFQVLHTFLGPDGGYPLGGLVMDADGNLYGTTSGGGLNNCLPGGHLISRGCGTVFRLSKDENGWSFATIYLFKSELDGAHPGALTIGPDGALYGTSNGNIFDGGRRIGIDTVFRLAPAPYSQAGTGKAGPDSWNKTVLYTFKPCGVDVCDGQTPVEGAVVFDNAGNLYGTTQYGGVRTRYGGGVGAGTVYKLSPSEGEWKETILHSFFGPTLNDGANPSSPVILDQAGNLYGTTYYGGTGGVNGGTVYELSLVGDSWQESVLYSFNYRREGYHPYAGVVPDGKGNLYGGITSPEGNVLELSLTCSGWGVSHIYLGPTLVDNLTFDSVGNLYGADIEGGKYYCGSFSLCGRIFRLDDGWLFTDLHDFVSTDGYGPDGPVLLDGNDNLYGTARGGGDYNCDPGFNGCGTVWMISQSNESTTKLR